MVKIFSIDFAEEDSAKWVISINGEKFWAKDDIAATAFRYMGIDDPFEFQKSFAQYGGYVITHDHGPFGITRGLYFVTERAAREAFAERIEPLLMAAKLRGLIDFEQKN